MIREIKFSELEQLLLDIGFVNIPTTGYHKLFEYPQLNAMVALPNYEKQQYVNAIHLLTVRRILSENGLMDTSVFDHLLEKVAS
ncbi:type II toxin-antitoxin system HicA family toxin [Nostoc sp. UHCC 0870]|uniref:type II toxin-antitoxin system HicA family toxin n=1 Tax=Nostoc sp. UHCC 0870 TaxID=2914041 RepID=UPI001EDD1CE9|nr:type II toxin-antitoxin system HicA family toxin [Nostoc sp. UHCC 0870]UKO98080.1 type II toxin-antitoxin system HicA family toxin [Nostoc sp. UHCC 0870]